MAYGRFECTAPRMFGHTSRYGWEASHSTRIMPTYVCHDIRKPQNTDRRRHVPAKSNQPRMPRHTSCNRYKAFRPTWEPKCRLAYATAYRTARKPEQQSRYSNPDSPAPNPGHAYSPITQGAEARTTHHTCSAELPPLESTGVYRSTDLLVYRLRLSRPYRPALALT